MYIVTVQLLKNGGKICINNEDEVYKRSSIGGWSTPVYGKWGSVISRTQKEAEKAYNEFLIRKTKSKSKKEKNFFN